MKVNLSTPNIKGNELILNSINNSLETGWVSTGPVCTEFEEKIKEYTGAKHAVVVASGTAALHLSYYAAGLERDDEVLVPTLTFIATINPIIYLGGKPILMDCDDTLNIDLDKVEKFLKEETYMENGFTYNKTTKARIKMIVPVHIFGNAIDMDRLNEIVKPYNIIVVEDAAESLGSFFDDGIHTGLKSFAGAISFNANKIMTTGGGGVVVTNNDETANYIRYISQQAKDDALRFIHNNLGYNYRMTDITAAVGLEQIALLQDFKNTKIENYNYYKEKLQGFEDKVTVLPFKNNDQNHWFFNLVLNNYDAYKLVKELEEDGIQTRPIWYLSHNQEFLSEFQKYEITKADEIFPKIISVPCSSHLTFEEIDYVCEKILERIGK